MNPITTITIKSKRWFKKPSISIQVDQLTELNQIDEVIQQLQEIKHTTELVQHFKNTSLKNLS